MDDVTETTTLHHPKLTILSMKNAVEAGQHSYVFIMAQHKSRPNSKRDTDFKMAAHAGFLKHLSGFKSKLDPTHLGSDLIF